jgi:uncharacterized membrane protein
MTYRRMTIASIVTVGVLAGIGTVALQRLPAGTQLPVHWNAAGQADGFADASRALYMPAVLAAVLSVVFAILPSIEPLQQRLGASAPLYRTAWGGLLGMLLLTEVVIAAPALGFWLPATLHLAASGVLLIAIGNVLPKSRPGFFVGIRTPWTLTDPENWIATHRLGARTMILGGATIVGAALLPIGPGERQALVLGGIAIAVIPPLIFSWWFWRRRAARS